MNKIEDLKEYLSKIQGGDKVYEFLLSINEDTPKGRRDFNDNLYVNVVSYQTEPFNNFDGLFESHKDYIDLHVLISGKENIFYSIRSNMTITQEYDKTDDYELLKGNKYDSVAYGKMQGVELFINEPHMAGYESGKCDKVLKAIVKIKK